MPAPSDRWNIVLVMPDQLRGDTLGCAGHPLVQTPHLDALAAEGVAFGQCHTQHPFCAPSRCVLFTGLYPHTRGHRSQHYPLQPGETNFLRDLSRAGYHVEWYGKNDLLADAAFADGRHGAPPPRRPLGPG